MPLSAAFKVLPSPLVLPTAVYGSTRLASAGNQSNPAAEGKTQACPNDDSGLQLPAGFCATIFADGIGHARHMVAAPSGVPYGNTSSGRYYGNDAPPAGGFPRPLPDARRRRDARATRPPR